MSRILGVGIATVDVVNIVDGYPPEDAEMRALDQRIARGGNAANTMVVLSQLGHACAWAGVWADEPSGQYIIDDLAAYRVDTEPSYRVADGKSPTSYVTVNRRNGSRTIVHYRDLPELTFEHFARLDLGAYDGLHFEGRNVAETRRMLDHVRHTRPELPCSIEVEKPREDIESLYVQADLILFSQAFCQATGWTEPEAFLAYMADQTPAATLVLSWGTVGAYARDRGGETCFTPAQPPPQVVDTLGAGDTFNAGIIHGWLQGWSLARSLAWACRLAGDKCGRPGLVIQAPPG